MKKLYFLLAFLALGNLMSFTVNNCSILENNSFKYKVSGKDVLVEFKEGEYIEYHEKKKYHIKSKIEWLSSCEYNLVIQEATLPNFPFKKGTVMHVKVTKVKGKKVYYTATLGGRSWKWKMVKIKKKG